MPRRDNPIGERLVREGTLWLKLKSVIDLPETSFPCSSTVEITLQIDGEAGALCGLNRGFRCSMRYVNTWD